MRTSKLLLGGPVLWLAACVVLTAQTVSKPRADVPLRPVVTAETPAQPAPPKYEMNLKWNERGTNVLTVPFKNESDRPMKVLGVQATRGIFIGDYPSNVGPKKEDFIAFVYDAADDTDGDIDIIRALTDQGIKEIHVKVNREDAVSLAAREVRWTVGDAATAKTVALTVTAGTATPTKVRATGGHTAVLEKSSATAWTVKITPSSTAKSGTFAVFVEFDQPLPGKATVILGNIQPKE
jgi:hypothetical protein